MINIDSRSLRILAIFLGALLVLYLGSSFTSSSTHDRVGSDEGIGSHATNKPTMGSYTRLNMSKVATMIETRAVPNLVPLIVNFLSNAPTDWPFVIWTGDENHDTLLSARALQNDISSGRLNFTKLDMTSSDKGSYAGGADNSVLSQFLAGSPWFWNAFHPEAEWMFFFQSDSIMCSKSEQSIDDWIGFDWVGGLTSWSEERKWRGGNGGLSMRRISSMRKITTERPRKPEDLAEDVYFVDQLLDTSFMPDVRWPGISQGKFSSTQGLIIQSEEANFRPLGVHAGFVSPALVDWCPEQYMMYMH